MKLLTPPGLAGIAVVSADAAERDRLVACLQTPTGAPLALAAGAPPRRATLQLGGVAIDDVLVVDRGRRGLEVHLHGAPAVLDAVRTSFALADAQPATSAEALLWRALGPAQLALALEQRELDAAGRGFASMLGQLQAAPEPASATAGAAALARSRAATALAEPSRLVLVGAQNAGKSTLFNNLLGRDRVLTGPLPGLTRDPIAEPVLLAGYPYELVDTAGEGPVADAVDAEALAAGRALRDGGIAILVVDRATGPDGATRALAATVAMVVATKADLPAAAWPADVRCDFAVAAPNAAPGELATLLGERLRAQRSLPVAGPVGGPAALTSAEFAALVALVDGRRADR